MSPKHMPVIIHMLFLVSQVLEGSLNQSRAMPGACVFTLHTLHIPFMIHDVGTPLPFLLSNANMALFILAFPYRCPRHPQFHRYDQARPPAFCSCLALSHHSEHGI